MKAVIRVVAELVEERRAAGMLLLITVRLSAVLADGLRRNYRLEDGLETGRDCVVLGVRTTGSVYSH